MNIDLTGRVYRVGDAVYVGYTAVKVHDQRGRRFIHYKGKQRNINDIPILPKEDHGEDYVFNYIFKGGFQTHPCPAFEYWIKRHRMKVNISPSQFKKRYLS